MSITRIRLHNFRKFEDIDINLSPELNILVGDNETGKSSILEAIHLGTLGSISLVESVGLRSIFNKQIVNEFLEGAGDYSDLPKVSVEIFLNTETERLYGTHNSLGINSDGVRLEIAPDEQYSQDINTLLSGETRLFPYEFYKPSFRTFAGEMFNSYNRRYRTLLIDNSIRSQERSIQNYVKETYQSSTSAEEKIKLNSEFAKMKDGFTSEHLASLAEEGSEFSFSLSHNPKTNLVSMLTISEEGIALEDRGRGRQCLAKVEFALQNSGMVNSNALCY